MNVYFLTTCSRVIFYRDNKQTSWPLIQNKPSILTHCWQNSMEDPVKREEAKDEVFYLIQSDNGERIERRIRKNQISLKRLSMMFSVRTDTLVCRSVLFYMRC